MYCTKVCMDCVRPLARGSHSFEGRSKDMGFTACVGDAALYSAQTPTGTLYIVLYVDDMLIAGKQHAETTLKAKLAPEFEATDLGEAKYFLGMEVNRNRQARILRPSQTKDTQDVLQRFHMDDANPRSTVINIEHSY